MQPLQVDQKPLRALYGMTPEEMTTALAALGIQGFKVDEILRWCFRRKVASLDGFTTLTKAERSVLKENFSITNLQLKTQQRSPDGTRKFLYELHDHHLLESVLIPSDARLTLCVSTQVGCPVRCKFCASGLGGLQRNLSAAEIIGQFMAAAQVSDKEITNVVFMGTGEPFLNFAQVMQAIAILHHEQSIGLGLRKITLSTVGIVGAIEQIFHGTLFPKLAISLHAPTDELRREIIPYPNILSVAEIREFVIRYTARREQRVTLEYVMLAGTNDSPQHAHTLGRLFGKLYVKLNLIPLNAVAETNLFAPEDKAVQQFARIVSDHGMTVTIRKSHGGNIDAACGQLRAKNSNKT